MDFITAIDVSFYLTILQMIPLLVMVWIGIVAAWGLLKKKGKEPSPVRDTQTNFGIIVCAHNEAGVIRSLFESLEHQHYPKDKIHVFLLADHCTDATPQIGREYHSATVFERTDGPVTGKGAVLQWGMGHIFDFDRENRIDAFAVIDADNVLREDFLSKMDLKLREGNSIVQGNRLGGQPYRSVITRWYTMYWACYTVFFSYAREKAGLSALLTGTGFAVDADILRKSGWHTDTITEDTEFSVANILQGRRVAFCVEAVCYDEQPYQFKVMVNQIQRWCTGGYQVLRKDFRGLLSGKSGIGFLRRFDVLMLLLMGPCSWISEIISLVNRGIMLWNLPLYFCAPFAFASLFGTVCEYIGVLGTLKYNHIGRGKIGVFAILTFPVFLWVYMFCSIKTCFLPVRSWKKIDHKSLTVSQE